MAKERILIAVKTYPTLSKKYGELVCTAGFREDGSWIRIYPSPFRFLNENQKYQKYQWINIDLEKNPKDQRPESYRPINIDNIELVGGVISTKNNWSVRKELILEKNTIYTNLNTVIQNAKSNMISLAIFKPKAIIDFTAEPIDPNWELSKKEIVEEMLKQGSLFQDEVSKKNFQLMPKLPYKFRFTFIDDENKKSSLMIEDWEIGQLYWNCFNKDKCSEKAIEKVKRKYFNDFALTKDIYFFLGTTFEWHNRGKNPFVIIGVFYPQKITTNTQMSLI